jgi:lipopolysaccharide/colanic/teichoic acid biosynthesis glycosyltransferase
LTPPSIITQQTIVPAPELALGPPRVAAPAWPLCKRALDVLVAVIALLALLPAFALIALAIKLDSPGPVFHRVRRVGYGGRPFPMLKFRKMHAGAAPIPLTAAGDPRLTRFGAFLTRTRVDELPQLWHVLRGEMSLIGPRPEDPRFVALHASDYDRILSVRPGITGITQLAFADERAILDDADPVTDYVNRIMPSKVRLDLLYADRCHIRLDLAVLYWTVRAVLTGAPIAVSRADGRMNARRRPAIDPGC